MSEINENVNNEGTQVNETAANAEEIVIQEESRIKRFLKGAVKVVAGLLVGLAAGFGLGRATGGNSEDDSDSAEAEGPKED